MKLWHSFIKELQLTSKSIYFYIEIFMAVLILLLLLFVIPESFSQESKEVIYINGPEVLREGILEEFIEDTDGKIEEVVFEIDDEEIEADEYYHAEDDAYKYIVDSKEKMIAIAQSEKIFGAEISLDDENALQYEYYLQGYETQKLRNLYKLFHAKPAEALENQFNGQVVKKLNENMETLSDRENTIPAMLTFNGSLMGLFIIGAYIFLDKKEGIITAYSVTASALWQYLLSKVGVIMVTSLVSTILILVPTMGSQPNYFILIIFLLATGFFGSSLGLLIASFYEDLMEAFGAMYIAIIVMIVPVIGYFIPSWNPSWLIILPSHSIINSFKELILVNGNIGYALQTSGTLFAIGVIIFAIANNRFKKTLRI